MGRAVELGVGALWERLCASVRLGEFVDPVLWKYFIIKPYLRNPSTERSEVYVCVCVGLFSVAVFWRIIGVNRVLVEPGAYIQWNTVMFGV